MIPDLLPMSSLLAGGTRGLQVALYNIAGVLIQELVVQVNSLTQKDTWEIPGGMAAGIYIIRAVQPGQVGGYTTKLMVQ